MKEICSIGEPFIEKGVSPCYAWQSSSGGGGGTSGLLAIASREFKSGERLVGVFDRRGSKVNEVRLPDSSTSGVTELSWDSDGEILAVLADGNPGMLYLWNTSTGRLDSLDTPHPPSLALWSPHSPHLMVGTVKGSMVVFNRRSRMKQTIMGQHSSRIRKGRWEEQPSNRLVLVSDKVLSVCDQEGEMVCRPLMISGEACELVLSSSLAMGALGLSKGGSKPPSVLLFDFSGSDEIEASEVVVSDSGDKIVSLAFGGGAELIVLLSHGGIKVLNCGEISQPMETFSLRPGVIGKGAVHLGARKIAVQIESCLHLLSLVDWKEIDSSNRIPLKNLISQISWENNGQILTYAQGGSVDVYLADLPLLAAVHGKKVIYMTSLREANLLVDASRDSQSLRVELPAEPSKLYLGAGSCAASSNNVVWYFKINGDRVDYVRDKTYSSNVQDILLGSEHVAILMEGRLLLESDGGEGLGSLPSSKMGEDSIGLATLSDDYLVYTCQKDEQLVHFSLSCMKEINSYRHDKSIRRLSVNPTGTRVLFTDSSGQTFLYNPVSEACLKVSPSPESSSSVSFPFKQALWDLDDSLVFAVIGAGKEAGKIWSFVEQRNALNGSKVQAMGEVSMGSEFKLEPQGFPMKSESQLSPLIFKDGYVICQTPNGSISSYRLPAYQDTTFPPTQNEALSVAKGALQAAILGKFQPGFRLVHWCSELLSKSQNAYLGDFKGVEAINQLWKSFLDCALQQWMEVPYAIRAARELKKPGFVQYLEDLCGVEESDVLRAHLHVFYGDVKEAQRLFLGCGRPRLALQLMIDLQDWTGALTLARKFDKGREKEVMLHCGQLEEAKANHKAAIEFFEKAQVVTGSPTLAILEHNNACLAGIARCAAQEGDFIRACQVAIDLRDPAVCLEVGAVLEKLRQLKDAAYLFELGGNKEKAVSLYIQVLEFDSAAPLLKTLDSPKLHLQFGKAKESRGAFKEAINAYEMAKDWDSVIRLLLHKTKETQKALALVRRLHYISGAELVADFCKENADVRGAVEFLLRAKKRDEAIELAEKHDEMDVLEDALESIRKTGGEEEGLIRDQTLRVAQYYESRNLPARAAKHYASCRDYETAVQRYLQSGQAVDLQAAIEVVGKAQSPALTQKIIKTLMEDSAAGSDYPKYIYQLHLSLGQYREASNTALIIAKQDQEEGRYPEAKALLLSTFQELRSRQLSIPSALWNALSLLHSYTLIKTLALGATADHDKAACMLLRVAENVQVFPKHELSILTSVVLECMKTNRKKEAYEWACVLVRPQYRDKIQERYKKKIEQMVRRPPKDMEAFQEPSTPCPYCDADVPESQLKCGACKNLLPFCILTGQHMTKDNWGHCPQCKFPASFSTLKAVLTGVETFACPMCQKHILTTSLPSLSSGAEEYLQEFKQIFGS